MTGRFNRPCLKCGVLVRGASYCAEHQPVKVRNESPERTAKKRTKYDATYKRIAKFVRTHTEACHICGEGWRPNDPWEADHLYPDDPTRRYELAGAHRSCNQKRGNKPLNPGNQQGPPKPTPPSAG